MPKRAIIPILGGENRGFRWIVGSAESACWLGFYEEDHQRAMRRLVRAGDVVYDVGASAGFFTLMLSRLVGPAGRVYAFEPNARNVAILQRHLGMNGIANVMIVQAAIGATAGLVGFGGAGQTGCIDAASNYLVPSLSLDDFVTAGFPVPSFVKMDIEGGERDALAAASKLLETGMVSWMVATHSAALHSQCLKLFEGRGYGCASGAADIMAIHGSPQSA